VFAGAPVPNAPGDDGTPCANWSAPTGSVTIGFSHATARLPETAFRPSLWSSRAFSSLLALAFEVFAAIRR